MKRDMKKNEREWKEFYIGFNPHFKEYHAIRKASGCSVFSSKEREQVVAFIREQKQPLQLELFPLHEQLEVAPDTDQGKDYDLRN